MKYLIAIPCMDMLHMPFVCALLSMPPLDGPSEIRFGANSLIYDTRNGFADYAISNGFDRILWLDSDMTFPPDFSRRLAKRLDEGYEYVTGLYMTRKDPIRPCIFSSIEAQPVVKAHFYDDYPKDSIFEIVASGFGGVMMTTDLVKRVSEKFDRPFSPMLGFGEDISFCIRASSIGAKMYCDSTLKMGHIGFREYTEESYMERLRKENEQT